MTILYYEFSDGTIVKTLEERNELQKTKGPAETKYKEYIRFWEELPLEGAIQNPNGKDVRALPLSKGKNSKKVL